MFNKPTSEPVCWTSSWTSAVQQSARIHNNHCYIFGHILGNVKVWLRCSTNPRNWLFCWKFKSDLKQSNKASFHNLFHDNDCYGFGHTLLCFVVVAWLKWSSNPPQRLVHWTSKSVITTTQIFSKLIEMIVMNWITLYCAFRELDAEQAHPRCWFVEHLCQTFAAQQSATKLIALFVINLTTQVFWEFQSPVSHLTKVAGDKGISETKSKQ